MGMKKLCVALAALALGAVAAVPASAAPTGNTIIEIRNLAYGTCLATTAQDTYRPSLATCDGSATQRFERVAAASGGVFLRNVGEAEECLDRLQQGWQLMLTLCNAESASQRIELVPAEHGTVRLRVRDKVAEAPYPDFGVLFEPESDYDIQRWQITEVGIAPPSPELPSAMRLKSAGYGICVTDTGTKPVMASCTGAANEVFQRVDLGEGKVALRTANGRCLANPSFSDVILTACVTGATSQQWTLTGDELGHYKIANSSTGNYLRPNSGDTAVGAYPYWGIGLSQQWLLIAG